LLTRDDYVLQEKKKKESILDLSKYLDRPIRVKFHGGREGEMFLSHIVTFSVCFLKADFNHLVKNKIINHKHRSNNILKSV